MKTTRGLLFYWGEIYNPRTEQAGAVFRAVATSPEKAQKVILTTALKWLAKRGSYPKNLSVRIVGQSSKLRNS